MTYLKLDPKHKEDLKSRGLTDQEIEFYGFKSTPAQTDAKAICRCLLSEGCTLRGVPGFYLDDKRDWTINLYKGNAGYFCPVFNTKQELVGFQIRVDKPKDGTKYIWFTSAGRNHGTSSGSPVTVLWGNDHTEAMIVEGVLKAAVVHAMSGKTVIGIPGVNNLSNLPATLSKMKDLKTIYEAMDMDKFLSVSCDHEEKEGRCLICKISDGICPYKESKRKRISEGRDKVISVCKSYKRILMRWDFSIRDGMTVWNGIYKGPDDYLNSERQKRNAL